MKNLPSVFVALAFLLLIAGCSEVSPASDPATRGVTSVSPAAVPSSPTAFLESTTTPTPQPTPTSSDAGSTIYAPLGKAASIDGTFSPGEWEDALAIDLANGELLLMHAGTYLYLGIRSNYLGLGSLCVNWEDDVSILHSSAALGTATYSRDGDGWIKTRDFFWTNRETSNSESALEKRREHLERENWLASNGLMGNLNEMEYQIAMTNDELRLAVTYLMSPDFQITDFWPETVGSGCRDFEPLQSDPPETKNFSPETWITVIASVESQ